MMMVEKLPTSPLLGFSLQGGYAPAPGVDNASTMSSLLWEHGT